MAYAAQMFRALEYLHGGHSVFHRDIKPSNLLVDRDKRELRLCDFGNAIVIEDGGVGGGSRKNSYSSYVCSRFYRAPGLLDPLALTIYHEQLDRTGSNTIFLLKLKPLF